MAQFVPRPGEVPSRNQPEQPPPPGPRSVLSEQELQALVARATEDADDE